MRRSKSLWLASIIRYSRKLRTSVQNPDQTEFLYHGDDVLPENWSKARERKSGKMGSLKVIRKMGISTQTFYRWKKQYGQMGVDEIRRLKQLEEENRKLKQLVADLSLDKLMLQDVLSKKL